MKQKWIWPGIILLLALIAGFFAFGNESPVQTVQTDSTPKAEFPVSIKDGSGTNVTIPKEPQRIVSLIPSNTEIVFALGLGAKVVGVSDVDNYPEEVKNLPKVGGMEINVEKVLSLKPDLVLASTTNGQVVNNLRKVGLNVLVVDANNLAQTYESFRLIGKATGTADAAEQLIEQMESVKKDITEKIASIPATERKKVWVELDPMLYTAGKETYIDEILTLAGGTNIIEEKGWPQINQEEVISLNPDVILITYADYVKDAVSQVKNRAAWKDVTAVKTGQVYDIHPDLISRPGPRVMDGLKQIAQYLYPESFPSQ